MRDYLIREKFDIALVDGDRLAVLSRDAADRAATTTPTRLVGEVAQSPLRDRVIERTLPMRRVTHKLRNNPHPLLVVGGDAITHIITVADFAGVAGTAAVLLALLTLDVKLNALLLTRESDAWQALDPGQRKQAEGWQRKAAKPNAALSSPLNYLSMSWRLQLVRTLGLAEKFDLGPKTSTRCSPRPATPPRTCFTNPLRHCTRSTSPNNSSKRSTAHSTEQPRMPVFAD